MITVNPVAYIVDAIVRIEKKVDELLKIGVRLTARDGESMIPSPMNSSGHVCPLCQRPVQYYKCADTTGSDLVLRSCGCQPPEDIRPTEI